MDKPAEDESIETERQEAEEINQEEQIEQEESVTNY